MADDNKVTLNDEQRKQLPDLAEVVSLLTDIAGKVQKTSEDREKQEKLLQVAMELNQKLSSETKQRTGEFSTKEAEEILRETRDGRPGVKAIDALLKEPSRDPNIVRVQETCDNAFIMSKMLNKPVSQLQYWREAVASDPILKAAIGVSDVGNAGVGGALDKWQPALFSAQMIEKIRLNYVISSLHPRLTMPADPWRFPVEGADALAYRVAAASSENANTDDSLNQKVPIGLAGGSIGADHILISAEKLGARVVMTAEVDEDSAVAIMPYVVGKLARAMSEASENGTFNGATDGSLDTGHGTYATTDQRRAWSGYRKFLQSVSTAKVTATTASALDIKDLRKVRQNMGKYGINPSDLVLLCGPIGYVKLLGLNASPSTDSPVLTVDKLGPNATILSGQLAQVDGIPIIVSEFVGPNMPGLTPGVEAFNVSGIYDGVTTTYTGIYFVRRSAFSYADRRTITLNRRYIEDTDQFSLVTLQRMTFFCYYPTEPVVGAVVGISK